MVSTRDTARSKKELWNLHWKQMIPLILISNDIYGDNISQLLGDMDFHDVPVRTTGTRVSLILDRQFDSTDLLTPTKFTTNGQTVNSELFFSRGYKSFGVHLNLIKTGTPTDSYLQIRIQTSENKTDWRNYTSDGWGFYIESNSTIPIEVTGRGYVVSRYTRLQFQAIKGTTLDSSNFFQIEKGLVTFQ